MNYTITHSTKYDYSDAVPVCHNIVHLRPRTFGRQICESSRLVVNPEPNDLCQQFDYYGNHASYFSIERPHKGLSITATSEVQVAEPDPPESDVRWNQLRDTMASDRSKAMLEAYEFAFSSDRTPRFSKLVDFTRKSFPNGRNLLEAVQELTERIYTEFEYDPTATTVSTPIETVLDIRRGVCQDFAHLQLACLRSLGLAARYVSGYLRTIPPPGQERLVGADASHAWVSVYFGEAGWIDFDPTNNAIPRTDHVTLAWGRDYHDVAPIQGVILGGGTHRMTVSVDVAPNESAVAD